MVKKNQETITIREYTVPVTRYIRHKITGEIMDYNPHALIRPENDYEPYDGPLHGADDDQEEPQQEGLPEDDRIAKIKAAIATLPTDAFGKPFGGKPAMPRVSAVTDAVGFRVTVQDIEKAMGI